MLPPVSLPMAKPTNPAAVAAPGPALEPDDPSSSNHGFMVWPPNQMSFSASAPKTQLGNQHRTRIVQPLNNDCVGGGNAIAKGLGAIGRGNACRVQKVFSAPWDAVQRPPIFPSGDFLIGSFGLSKRQVAGEGNDAAQLGIELLQPGKINLSKPLWTELALLNPKRELSYGCEGDVFIMSGQSARDRSCS